MPTWEERWHPLREEWVIVAAHRQNRPWIGATVEGARREVPAFDPQCTFCPGHVRVSGARNPVYDGIFVFDNDHPCVGDAAPEPAPAPDFFRRSRAEGIARVVCYTPRHDLSLAELDVPAIDGLLAVWQDQHR